MSRVKCTKNELRKQQQKLVQLRKYLPTLQLKKALLQVEVADCILSLNEKRIREEELKNTALASFPLYRDIGHPLVNESLVIESIEKEKANIAGIDIEEITSITFAEPKENNTRLPLWAKKLVVEYRALIEQVNTIAYEVKKCLSLEQELRDVSIRVNLFEKRLIPEAQVNIKKIRVFLGDQQLTAVAQAKVAKRKVDLRNLKGNA